jgi:hypothetical protein
VHADRPAEVVHHQAEVVQPEPLDERVEHGREQLEGVRAVDRLAGRAEAGQVGDDDAVVRRQHRRDVPVEERRRRPAVQEQQRRAVALVDEGDGQAVDVQGVLRARRHGNHLSKKPTDGLAK